MKTKYQDQIWKSIDMSKFEKFHKASINIIQNSSIYATCNYGPNSCYSFINCKSSIKWEEDQVEKNLPMLYSLLQSKSVDSDEIYREEETYNSGTNTSVKVTAAEYEVVKESGLLKVVMENYNPKDKTWKIRYQHPSVFHAKSLHSSGKISSVLYNNISSYSEEKLKKDSPLRRTLTRLLMKDLLKISFQTIRNTKIDSPRVSYFFQEFARIRPFNSNNHIMKR